MSFVTTRVNTLNHRYKRGMEISSIIVLLLIIAAFEFAPEKSRIIRVRTQSPDPFIPTFIDPTKQISQPPSRPAPPIPVLALPEDEIQDIILESSEIDYSSKGSDIPERPIIPELNEEEVPFHELEKYPELIGGPGSIAKNIRYTDLAKRARIEGTVVIEFIIDKSGKVEDARVIKSLEAGLDSVALRAVKAAEFVPGMQRDKPVRVRMDIPIKFKLN